ncbi:MAG TPA: hypothetical protein VI791_03500 [Patescibacteria group bacterium]|nr:hypothetical protein [Patescibacteria group bacterium]
MASRRQKPIYAFIDSQNLNLGVRSQGWRFDLGKHETKGNVDAELVLNFTFDSKTRPSS